MADSQITTSVVATTFPGAQFSELDHFTYPAIFALMANSVQKHDPELFKRCAGAIDMGHTHTLRGLGYLGQLLARDRGASDMQRTLAGDTIAEMTAFVAALIEMQNDANLLTAFPG